jgi:fido (protein-threonine AMPylation protein)
LIIRACKRQFVLGHGEIKTYHQKIFCRVVPLDYYAGNYRSVDPQKPCLARDVEVSGLPGESFRTVPSSMSLFSTHFQDLVSRTDQFLGGRVTPTDRAQAVAQLAAVAMANLVRIHPFLNGNGRLARMLVNYIFKRYGYGMPFRQAQIRPPETEYSQASAAAMGSGGSPIQLYIYLLRLVARSAASPN